MSTAKDSLWTLREAGTKEGRWATNGRSTLVPHPLSYTVALTDAQVNPQRDDFSGFASKIQAFGN